jgi:hypothetical protein
MKGISTGRGLLRIYNPLNAVLKQRLIIGSLIPNEKNREDEFDICKCIVFQDMPNIVVSKAINKGEVFGFLNRHQANLKIRKDPEPGHLEMEKYMLSNPYVWFTTDYHHCPHYILPFNEEEPTDEIFYCDVYPIEETEETWRLGSCLISLSVNHPLYPKNKADNEDNDFERIYQNVKWVVSNNPITIGKFEKEGLINC